MDEHKPIKEVLGRNEFYWKIRLGLWEINQLTRRQVYSLLKARGYTYIRKEQRWAK